MSLFGWLTGKRKQAIDGPRSAWHKAWADACAAPSSSQVAHLSASLTALGLSEDETEIEREMLAGLEHLASVQSSLPAGTLPEIATGHRVVGTDRCHFSAPVSMPDEATQPSGRLILTNVRAIFAGGGKATTIPWHAVADVLQSERDLILVRRDRESFHRFRCNVYADALEAVWLSRALANGHRPRQPPPQRSV
jgi:hypothetical protein